MIVETLDGNIFRGIDLKQITRKMKNEDFGCPDTIREYMETISERIENIYGKKVRTDQKVYGFMEDLEQLELIKIRKEV